MYLIYQISCIISCVYMLIYNCYYLLVKIILFVSKQFICNFEGFMIMHYFQNLKFQKEINVKIGTFKL